MKKSEIEGDDVDDIIGIAARMMNEDEGKLSVEDLREIGDELDIPIEYIERARKELTGQREREKVQAQKQKAKSKTIRMAAAGIALFLAAILLIGTWSASSALRELQGGVEQTKAQVENVKARAVEVTNRLRSRPESPDKDAELSGAANRIRVETKRYNDAMAQYNTRASGVFGKIASALFGLPTRL